MVNKLAKKMDEESKEQIEKLAATQANPGKKGKKNRKRNKKNNNTKPEEKPSEKQPEQKSQKRKQPDDEPTPAGDSKRQKVSESESSDVVPELVPAAEGSENEIEVESLGSQPTSDDEAESDDQMGSLDEPKPIDPHDQGGALLELMMEPMDLDQFAK